MGQIHKQIMWATLPKNVFYSLGENQKTLKMCCTVFLYFRILVFFPRQAGMVKKTTHATVPLSGLSFCKACIICIYCTVSDFIFRITYSPPLLSTTMHPPKIKHIVYLLYICYLCICIQSKACSSDSLYHKYISTSILHHRYCIHGVFQATSRTVRIKEHTLPSDLFAAVNTLFF